MTSGLDFSQYRHPGVYVDAGSNPTLATAGVAPTVVCLIGTGVGYHTAVETLSFLDAEDDTITLSKKGINPSSIVVKGYITDPNASGQSIPYVFEKDDGSTTHDYAVATDTTGGTQNSVTTITKSTGGKIEDAYPQVTVSYQYTDASYHELHQFDDYASIVDTYGPSLDPVSGALISPLTFAAEVAIINGANRVYTIALNPATGTVAQQFADAYQTLSVNNTDVNVVVPLFDGVTSGSALTGMLATLNAALLADANRGVLRMALCGLDQSYTGSPSDVATLASGISSPRIVLAYPNQLQYYNGVLNGTMTVDGYYLAAAFAGILSKQDPQMPLTKKRVVGFSGLPDAVARTLTETNKDILATGGVTVVHTDRQLRLVVRHGLTTDYSGGILQREISLVRGQDALYALLQTTMDNSGLIGIPIGENTALQVKGIVAGALETAKSSATPGEAGLIVSYGDLAVRQQAPPSGDPTVIDVRFSYKPAWPLNYITMSFSVDTSNDTGGLTNLSAAAA